MVTMPSKRRKRRDERPSIHPRNKYSEKAPYFRLLASLFPSFEPFIFYSRNGRPRIDWIDFNATRELTRVLLDHDHGVKWGRSTLTLPKSMSSSDYSVDIDPLCPTVPNRSNSIHWIEDLILSDIMAKTNDNVDKVKGFDIGTGANCIYPLLGASLLGWSFVGSDITDVALEWAERNVQSNPHLSELIEIRKVADVGKAISMEEADKLASNETRLGSEETTEEVAESSTGKSTDMTSELNQDQYRSPVLLGVIRNDEHFDFCMCNPPFFESIEEAGLNPKTACGGTPAEMVCPGGERAFITSIIEDSVALKHSFRWYTSMLGRKANLKFLVAKLWEVGASVVKTTEFVQGETCRWGLAWSFLPTAKKIVASHVAQKNNLSFMLEDLQRQFSAFHVLKSVESYFLASGASCKSDSSVFVVDVTASKEYCEALLKNGASQHMQEGSEGNNSTQSDELRFRISVFQQIPGTLLLRGSLQHSGSPLSDAFSPIFQQLEEALRKEFSGRSRK